MPPIKGNCQCMLPNLLLRTEGTIVADGLNRRRVPDAAGVVGDNPLFNSIRPLTARTRTGKSNELRQPWLALSYRPGRESLIF